jgi:hypothetical protein
MFIKREPSGVSANTVVGSAMDDCGSSIKFGFIALRPPTTYYFVPDSGNLEKFAGKVKACSPKAQRSRIMERILTLFLVSSRQDGQNGQAMIRDQCPFLPLLGERAGVRESVIL